MPESWDSASVQAATRKPAYAELLIRARRSEVSGSFAECRCIGSIGRNRLWEKLKLVQSKCCRYPRVC